LMALDFIWCLIASSDEVVGGLCVFVRRSNGEHVVNTHMAPRQVPQQRYGEYKHTSNVAGTTVSLDVTEGMRTVLARLKMYKDSRWMSLTKLPTGCGTPEASTSRHLGCMRLARTST
jgi:hypothetical protein